MLVAILHWRVIKAPAPTCHTMHHAQHVPNSCRNGCFLRSRPALRDGRPFLRRLLDRRWRDPGLGRIWQLFQQLRLLLRQLWSTFWHWLHLQRQMPVGRDSKRALSKKLLQGPLVEWCNSNSSTTYSNCMFMSWAKQVPLVRWAAAQLPPWPPRLPAAPAPAALLHRPLQ